METNVIPAWHYIWKCLYRQLLSVCQISCLYQKVHNSPAISSYAAVLFWIQIWKNNILYCFNYGLGIYRWKEDAFKKNVMFS